MSNLYKKRKQERGLNRDGRERVGIYEKKNTPQNDCVWKLLDKPELLE